MKRVLFIAYHFPPTGGAPAQRSLKFARFLPAEGYLPVILTGPGTSHDEWTPQDPSLAKELQTSVPVHRIPPGKPPARNRLMRRAERWLQLQSTFGRWWIPAATRLGDELLEREGAALIYASMSPFESAPVAARLSAKHGIPWVADLRDPWAIDEIQVFPTLLHRQLAQRSMHRLLSTAAVIIMNTSAATARLLDAFPDFRKKRVVTITNGFDSEDLASTTLPPPSGKFTIVHAGSFLTDSGLLHRRRRRLYEGLGGAMPGVDIATRSHLALFQAISRWISEDSSVRDNVQVVFAGNAPRLASASPEEEAVMNLTRFEGYLPREESLGIVRAADLLFLAMHNLPEGFRSTSAPSKMYEYMASGRPILAAVPDGDARDFLSQAGTASLCRPDDCDGMLKALVVAYDRWKNKKPAPALNTDFVSRFERRRLTRALAGELDATLGTKPAALASA